MTLELGYAQATLTPPLTPPVFMAGFGQNRVAQTVHDDLYARALVLRRGQDRVALVALDLLGLTRSDCLDIGRSVNQLFPGLRTIVACTHTHHAPDTLGLWGPDETTRGVDDAYLAWLKQRVVETVQSAAAGPRRMAPVMAAASRHVPGVVKNARDPAIVDDELTVLHFRAANNATLAVLLIFPCHPETLWEDNPHLTSDYVFPLRRDVETALQGPCLFFAGALGGMLTPDVTEHAFADAERIGTTLAAAAVAALQRPNCSVATDAPQFALRTTRVEFDLPMSSPLFELAMQAGLLTDRRTPAGSFVTETNLLEIGPVRILTVPGELLPKLGLALKARMRADGAPVAAVLGLANDELGYILPRDDFVYPDDPIQPGAHYEETMSVGPETGPRLLEAIERLLAPNH